MERYHVYSTVSLPSIVTSLVDHKVTHGTSPFKKGLGRSLALRLISLGADVTIVARDVATLSITQSQLHNARISKSQKCHVVSADVSMPAEAIRAVQDATLHVSCPDFVFCCAGTSKPGFMHELDNKDYAQQVAVNYLGTVYTVKEATRLMIQNKIKGKVIMTSSVVGLFSFIGYSAYSPTKFALRGFAEALKYELSIHDITTHCYFPGTLDSPGLVKENKIKPQIVKDIEGVHGMDTMLAAKKLINGLQRGETFISTDFIGNIARVAGSCAVEWNNVVYDFILYMIVLPIVRMYINVLVFLEKRKLSTLNQNVKKKV